MTLNSYERGLKMAAKDVEGLLEQGFGHLDKSEYKKATRVFDKVIKQDPKNSLGYFGKAEASMGVTKLSLMDLSKLYRQAVELEPENDLFLSSYADFCLSNGLLDKGAELFEKVAELIPENASTIYIDLAYGYSNYGLLYLSRQFNKGPEDIYREAFAFLLKGLDLDENRAKDMLEILEKMEAESGDGLPEFPSKNVLYEKENVQKKENPELSDIEKRFGGSKDPLVLLDVGQEFFYSSLPLTGEGFYLKAIVLDEEMGFEIYNDLASLLYTSGRDLVQRGEIDNDVGEEFTAKSLYYSIRAMGLNTAKLNEIFSK